VIVHVLAAASTTSHHMTWFQAIFIGLIQGATELFPISSLGHSVLIPALFGWDNLVTGESANESFFLAFLVGLHVATALVLLAYFWKEWRRVFSGLGRIVRTRRVGEDRDARLAFLLVLGTIPVGLFGLAFEHSLRTLFAKPEAAAAFLMLNGLILGVGELVRRRNEERTSVRAGDGVGDVQSHGLTSAAGEEGKPIVTLGWKDALFVGCAQIGALFAGVSRSGITMIAGLFRGLDHEDAAKFSFLLATPVILLAGLYKLPDLMGSNGDGVRGQVLVGSIAAAVAAFVSVRFLVRYFKSRNLIPFAIYCLAFGGFCLIYFA
jgi:undecaprenyl-diphosphatase